MNLILSYPWWFVIICIFVAAGYSGGLYFKNKRNAVFSKQLIKLLAVLRFVTVFILCFLLLEPLIALFTNKVEKPIIVFLHDNSGSILMNKDSLYYKNEFPKAVKQLEDKLTKSYEVATYYFDGKINDRATHDFSGKETDINQALSDILLRYSNRNVGAIVLSSDGIYNKGFQPQQTASYFNVPIYTIALGDTTPQKDAFVQQVDFNKIVFLDNEFPIDVALGAHLLKGQKANIRVLHNGQTLATQTIAYNENDFFQNISFRLKAAQIGLQRYQIVLDKVDGEFTYRNNSKEILVEVIDSRQKVLILAESVHPDLGALKNSIESNKHYQTEIGFLSSFQKSFREFDLVITYQLPSLSNNAAGVFQQLKENKIPAFHIIGNSTQITQLNMYNLGVKLTGNRNNSDEVQAVVNKDFGLFQLSDETQKAIAKFPPLISPFASDIQVSPNAQSVLYKKIGNTSTTIPLLFFSENNQIKNGFLLGEGFWKWRLTNYATEQNFTRADEIISKIIQFLSVKEDKSLFRVNVNQEFNENEDVILFAELYNESFDFVPEQDIQIEIKSEDNVKYPFSFSPQGNTYKLSAGKFSPGKYEYTAQAKLNGKVLVKKGIFFVKELQMEANQTQANHQLLYMLSSNSKGEMYVPATMHEIENKIETDKEIVSLIHSSKEITDLIRFKTLFFVLLFFLSLEWFLRKYNGGY